MLTRVPLLKDMTDSSHEMLFFNRIEPKSLISSFLIHPPIGFTAQVSEHGLPLFFTPFNLLTTADDNLRARIPAWPGYRFWKKALNIHSCFIGTTVSEYALFPRSMKAETLALWLRENRVQETKLTIIKDVPQNSPLLTASENNYSQRLIDECTRLGFINLVGQALAYVPIDFASIDEYLSRLSHSRRRNIRRKLRSRKRLRLETISTGDARFNEGEWCHRLYQLYLAVYQQSEIHFDLLSYEFFTQLLCDANGVGLVFCYWHHDELVGYNLCYHEGNLLIDKYIGLNYPMAREYNLYFVSWFVNLEYALANKLYFYVAGWTDPQVKANLGAHFTLTRHLVWVRNPLLRWGLNRFRHRFESDSQWQQESIS